MESRLNNPFKGLQPYEQKDKGRLFGRDKDLILMKDRIFSGRTTLLFAGSGVGKTSFLNAKVIPALSQGFFIFYYKEWAAKGEPLAAIKRALCDHLKLDPDQASQPLTSILGRFVKPPAPLNDEQETINQCLIILDQFEEIFQYHAYEPYFCDFIDELCAVVNASDLQARLVVSMREEFLGELSVFDNRIPDLFNNYYRLKYPDKVEAEDIIENTSLRLAEVEVDQEGLTKLVADLSRIEKGAGSFAERASKGQGSKTRMIERDFIVPPYLQIACRGLWDQQFGAAQNGEAKSRAFLSGYKKEGARAMLRKFCNDKLSSLRTFERFTAARAFSFLVTKQGAKMAYELTMLSEHMRLGEKKLQQTLQKLSAPETRILRESRGPDGSHWFELYHDMYGTIVDEWKGKIFSKVKKAAIVAGLLFLATLGFLVFYALPEWVYNPAGYQYMLKSEDASYQDAHEAYLNLRKTFFYGDTAEKLWASYWERRAMQEELKQNRDGALLLWLEALKYGPEGEAADRRRRRAAELTGADFASLTATYRQINQLQKPVLSADGNVVVTQGRDGSISLWDTFSGEPIDRQLELGRSPDGTTQPQSSTSKSNAGITIVMAAVKLPSNEVRIAVSRVGSREKLEIWQAGKVECIEISSIPKKTATTGRTPQNRIEPEVPRTGPRTIAVNFSPDGKYLAYKSSANDLQVWKLSGNPGGDECKASSSNPRVHQGNANSFEFSPDSRLLAITERNAIRLLSLESPSQEARTIQLPKQGNATDFSPDGRALAVRYADNTAQVWPLAPDQEPGKEIVLKQYDDFELSDGGERFLKRGVRWNVESWKSQSGELIGATDRLLQSNELDNGRGYMIFHPDGEHVLTGSNLGVTRLSKINITPPSSNLINPREKIGDHNLSSDGKLIITATETGKLQVWSADTLQPLGEPLDTGAAKNKSAQQSQYIDAGLEFELTISPNCKLVAKSISEKIVTVWDTRRTDPVFNGVLDVGVNWISFSPEGKYLAILDYEQRGQLLDTTTFNPVPGVNLSSGGTDSFFSEDDTFFCVLNGSGELKVWNLSEGSEVPINQSSLGGGDINNLTFERNRLVISSDYTAQVWDLTKGAVVSKIGVEASKIGDKDSKNGDEEQGVISKAAISPDGRSAVTVSGNGILKLWDITIEESKKPIDSADHKNEIALVKFTGDGRLITISGIWAYTFSIEGGSLRHLSSTRIGDALSEKFRIKEDDGLKIRVVSKLINGALEVRDIDLDGPAQTTALEGAPSALHDKWQTKVSLTISSSGEIVPLYQTEVKKKTPDDDGDDDTPTPPPRDRPRQNSRGFEQTFPPPLQSAGLPAFSLVILLFR